MRVYRAITKVPKFSHWNAISGAHALPGHRNAAGPGCRLVHGRGGPWGSMLPLALEIGGQGGYGGGVKLGVRGHGGLRVYAIGLNEIFPKG